MTWMNYIINNSYFSRIIKVWKGKIKLSVFPLEDFIVVNFRKLQKIPQTAELKEGRCFSVFDKFYI